MKALAVLALVPALVLPAPAAASAAACTWSPSTLTGPPGSTSPRGVYGTDHNGGWAGKVYFSGDRTHVVSWKNGTVTDYGGAATTTAFVTVVGQNRTGTIVGNTTDGYLGSIRTAFRIRGGAWEQLTPVAGGSQPIAEAINDTGDIIGTNIVNRNGNVGTVVVRWPAGQQTAVEVPGLPLRSTAIDIDVDGTLLIGLRDPATQGVIPHLLRGSTLTALPPLPRTTNPRAVAISNGRVVGGVSTRSGPNQGVVWEAGVPRALPGSTEGLLINRDGLIIGSTTNPNVTSHGVWRNGTLEHSFGTFEDGVFTGAISDEGTFGGVLRGNPTVWRCS